MRRGGLLGHFNWEKPDRKAVSSSENKISVEITGFFMDNKLI